MTITIRNNKVHFLTILFCAGLIIWIRHHPDATIWMLLFLSIGINAILFIIGHGILFISWLVLIVGILGIIMSLPHLWEWSLSHLQDSSSVVISHTTIQSILYFMATIFFSGIQTFGFFR